VEGGMRTAINLLPGASQRQLMLRRRLTQWSVVVCTAVLVMWVARWYKLREYHVLGQQREVLEREYRPLRAMVKEITQMRQQLEDLDQQDKVAKELDHQRQVLALLGVVSQIAEQSNGKLRVTNFQLLDLQSSLSSEQQHATGSSSGNFTLLGVSLDSPTVAELLDKLQHSGLFRSVELVSLKERQEGQVSLHDFQVVCNL
jgi:Tfp pilus assembly protein PilN